MNTARVTPGEMIAAAGGLGLFLFLFVDWFGPISAWEGFDIMDIVLAAIAVAVVALVAARAAGVQVALPWAAGRLIMVLGFAATVVVLTFLLEGEEREIGLFLSLLSSLAIMYGGWAASRGVAPRATPGTTGTGGTIGAGGTTSTPGTTGTPGTTETPGTTGTTTPPPGSTGV